MKHFVVIILFLISIKVWGQTPCNKLPQNYLNFKEANSQIKNAKFNYSDKFYSNESSWIKGARYFSCDKKVGYLFLITDKKEYIFKNIPIHTWLGFKNAPSAGKYYNTHIREKYKYLTYVNVKNH